MPHVWRLIAPAAACMMLAACDTVSERPDVLALWLPNDDIKTFETARRVRISICDARLVTRGPEARYQEWSVDSQHWTECRSAVKALGWQDSGTPVNWIFVRESPVISNSEVDAEIDRQFIRFPDYQAFFTHLTGHTLKEAGARWPKSQELRSIGRSFSFRDHEGRIREATVSGISFNENASSYSLDLDIDLGGFGFFNATRKGFTGFIALEGVVYDFYVAKEGLQFLEERQAPAVGAHTPKFSGGALFTSTDAQRMTEAVQKIYAQREVPNRLMPAPASIDSIHLDATTIQQRTKERPNLNQCPRAYPFTGPATSTVRVLFAYATTDEPNVTVYSSDFDPVGKPVRLARDWDEVAETLARRATRIFERQSLGTRVQSAGAISVNISDEHLDEAIGPDTSHDGPMTFKISMLAALGVDPSDEGDRNTVTRIREAMKKKPELAAQIAALRRLLTEERDNKQADIVALITAPTKSANQEFCGVASSIRAQPGSAFLTVRLDCAWLNESFTHELGHLLGARHEKQKFYDCQAESANGECELDIEDYGPKPPPFEVPAPEFNRAYVDTTKNTGTLMTSGYNSRTTPFLSVFSSTKKQYRRLPYWSRKDAAATESVVLSDGCCDDGAVVENYAANCVSKFFPDVPDETPPAPPSGWDSGPNDAPFGGGSGLDARDLEATIEFKSDLPLRTGLIRYQGRTHMRGLELELHQQQFLTRVAKQLSGQGITRFYVEGFADSKLDSKHNERIAERRMIAVGKYLCDLMPSGSIGTESYGERAALTDQRAETSEVRNRRVLISWREGGLKSGGNEIPVKPCDQFKANDIEAFMKKDRSEVVTGKGTKLELKKRR